MAGIVRACFVGEPGGLVELIRGEDSRKVQAVMEAMMTMVKLDVAALERAYEEA